MQPTAEEEGGRRLALVIATASYSDPTLDQLRAPGDDAKDLADVLADPDVGGFDVEAVLDAPTERRSGGGSRASATGADLAIWR